MSLLLELGRFLVAGGVRVVGRKLVSVADAIDVPESLERGFAAEADPGPVVTPEAAAMVAGLPPEPLLEEAPVLAGSLADRGRKIGQPWAR